jgi:hypothetical protein
MPQFDAASVVTSNPYCVIGKEFLSRNHELLGDMRDRGREASPARQRAGRGTFAPARMRHGAALGSPTEVALHLL